VSPSKQFFERYAKFTVQRQKPKVLATVETQLSARSLRAVLTSAAHWVADPRIQILCTPEATNVRAGLGWRALGAKIRNYLDERSSGSHRYYLSEREFAFFIRQPDESFLGFHGEDEELLATLKNAFEAEWDANEPPNKAMQPDGPSGRR